MSKYTDFVQLLEQGEEHTEIAARLSLSATVFERYMKKWLSKAGERAVVGAKELVDQVIEDLKKSSKNGNATASKVLLEMATKNEEKPIEDVPVIILPPKKMMGAPVTEIAGGDNGAH
jgi:hypothetical protein